MNTTPLQILLRDGFRTNEAIKSVARILGELGLEVTASGRATLSARASAESFERLFGPASHVLGANAGTENSQTAQNDVELPIPAELRDSIASITVAPKSLYLNRPDRKGGSP